MLILAFALPLVVALICLALNRTVATRLLGVTAALACVLSAALLAAAWQKGERTLPEATWTILDNQAIRLALGFDNASLPLAVLATAGGGICLLGLALSLPASLRGFGGLLAALLLILDATLAGLGTLDGFVTLNELAPQAPLLPFSWAMVAILGFIALRSSGMQTPDQDQPLGLVGGLIGALGLLGATLDARFSGTGLTASTIAVVCWIGAVLLATGAPPFHQTVDEQAEAPASIAGFVLALGLPLLASSALLRFVAAQAGAPNWRIALSALGLLTLLASAAGALRERRVRPILGWQMSGQIGVLFVALGQNQVPLTVIAPPLLINAALTTLLSFTAVALLERRTGTDDLTLIKLPAPFRSQGLAFAVAAASAIGLPGTWGFWTRRWLFDELLATEPWLVAPLLAGSVLLGLSYLAPLVAFWRSSPGAAGATARQRDLAAFGAQTCTILLAVPLLVLGVAPQLAWNGWGAAAQSDLLPIASGNAAPPVLPGSGAQIGYGFAAVLLLALPLALGRRVKRHEALDPELELSGVQAPAAIGESLSPLAWIGSPNTVFERIWAATLWASGRLSWALGFIEQRYYLAGLMVAVVAVILLLLQE